MNTATQLKALIRNISKEWTDLLEIGNKLSESQSRLKGYLKELGEIK